MTHHKELHNKLWPDSDEDGIAHTLRDSLPHDITSLEHHRAVIFGATQDQQNKLKLYVGSCPEMLMRNNSALDYTFAAPAMKICTICEAPNMLTCHKAVHAVSLSSVDGDEDYYGSLLRPYQERDWK
jgi:hypothetical protein